jgi:hypothetical protein
VARAETVARVHLLQADARRVGALLQLGSVSGELSFASHDIALAEPGNAFLATALLPSMLAATRLEVDAPVSPRLLAALPEIMQLVHGWDPRYRPIRIHVGSERLLARDDGRGVACFFSGGIDSFHSVLQNLDRLSALVFIHGFDIPLGDGLVRQRVATGLRSAARELGKPLIEVETNARELLEQFAPWTALHGAVLASVALLLGQAFREMIIPATHPLAQLRPHGSHPWLDPLWSSEAVKIVHHGAEVDRIGRITAIAGNGVVQRWVRVCWRNTAGTYNCGACVKCLQALAGFREAGALGRLRSFPAGSLRAVRLRAFAKNLLSSEERDPAFGPRSLGVNDPAWASRRQRPLDPRDPRDLAQRGGAQSGNRQDR